MTKSQIFKSKFPEFVGVVDFFTSDCEQLNFIDVPNDSIDFTTTITLSCQCCSDIDQNMESLSYIMDLMSDYEFEDLLELFK